MFFKKCFLKKKKNLRCFFSKVFLKGFDRCVCVFFVVQVFFGLFFLFVKCFCGTPGCFLGCFLRHEKGKFNGRSETGWNWEPSGAIQLSEVSALNPQSLLLPQGLTFKLTFFCGFPTINDENPKVYTFFTREID